MVINNNAARGIDQFQRPLYHNGASAKLLGEPESLDVLVVGGGFAGIYLLYKLRKKGFKVKIVEMGSDLGGVWYWNRYPGARADTQYPIYALSLPEVYGDWNWKSHYPDSEELRQYFAHIDDRLSIKKDAYFDTRVVDAEWGDAASVWNIRCDNGRCFRAQYFIPAIGFAAKRYVPDWEGIETFKGVIHHSSFWPKEGVDVRGKRVGVLGSGSTGVQITQEWADEIGDDGDLKMFQRTPNLCCPMKNVFLTPEDNERDRPKLPELFNKRWQTFGGFLYQYRDAKLADASVEEREALFEELWQMGGFRFLMNNFYEVSRDVGANRHAYNFWRTKVLQRIQDPINAKLFAPEEPPHPFGAKRLALEVNFYEQFERPNVNVVDIKTHPIVRIEPTGVVTADGTLHELDIIAVATGFDGITGGFNDIRIKGRNGQLLSKKWSSGARTYLGITSANFPNFFFTFGPQAPTAFSNGPTCVELQGDWLVDTLEYLRSKGYKSIDAKEEGEAEWKKLVFEYSARGLKHYTNSWWNGGNIPGKVQEPLNYGGGIPLYLSTMNDIRDRGYTEFDLR